MLTGGFSADDGLSGILPFAAFGLVMRFLLWISVAALKGCATISKHLGYPHLNRAHPMTGASMIAPLTIDDFTLDGYFVGTIIFRVAFRMETDPAARDANLSSKRPH